MAIFVLLLLGGLSVLTLQYVRIHAILFADSYNKERAEIFLQSALEAALMRIEANESDLNMTSADGAFRSYVEVEKCYLYRNNDNHTNINCPDDKVVAVGIPESNGYILLKIVVESTPNAKILMPIRITRRSLQRP